MMFDLPPSSSAIPSTSSGNILDLATGEGLRKRNMHDQGPAETKRPRWYYKLESESSRASEEDTESVYSMQGHTTELAQDTPDTESKSEDEDSENDLVQGTPDSGGRSDYDLEVEYEVASLSEGENPLPEGDSSSGTDDMLAAAGAIAAVICDTSLEAWLTDGEDSDNSSVDEAELNRTDFWTCIKCKSQNNNPMYRYCQKCFQERKNLFPPRPRGNRRRRRRSARKSKKNNTSPPRIASQDSGIGLSQELSPLDFDVAGSSKLENDDKVSVSNSTVRGTKRKNSSSIESDENTDRDDSKRMKNETVNDVSLKSTEASVKSDCVNDVNLKSTEASVKSDCVGDVDKTETQTKCVNGQEEVKNEIRVLPECKELCVICNAKSKDSIFVHGKSGHMFSCYKCAMRSWITNKRCPVCNRKVNNIVKVFNV